MTPIVNGQVHTFEHGGLYDGMFLMRDRQTGSTWNHITGECVYGPLKGAVLKVGVLELQTAGQAAGQIPDAHLALSSMSWFLRLITRFQQRRSGMEAAGMFPPGFRKTMGKPDPRLPEMEIGLGVWTGASSRFYPRQQVIDAGNVVLDQFEGRKLVTYIDPQLKAPAALYADAASARWHNDTLELGNGVSLKDGKLTSDGTSLNHDRPQQMLTRWYGFRYTFPECEIWSPGTT